MFEISRRRLRLGALIAGFTLVAACGGASSDAAPEAKAPADTVANSAAHLEGALGEMTIGSDDAPVTVVEYASVTCPHCATFHEDVLPEIKKNYVETGKVRFVFREFPTAPAELAIAGSMLARCAADKGGDDAYFLILGALFKGQKTWIFNDPRGELIKIAAQAGMNEADFDACVKRQEIVDLINSNVQEAIEVHAIQSTPSFLINGQLRRVSNLADFSAALDAALEAAE